ncbi:hypothetical protein [Pseudoruegeria sp. SHC-113]|uniref:hypothetical protein n=1 Tax=Pseudoruegeria sp. SHC-113 TaxID=2855439 RepID=UPI0021BA6EBD|nr:hypothetical protein [Pseudoruegeria sp. SHC-113]MCT8161514.1 hypothetical protein [Pseudoruegeria sp. SHC-113]
MIRHLPYVFRGLLLIALVLASVATGALRGQAEASGSAVFCVGLVPQVMAVDADGKPVSQHHCPDCTLAGLAALLPEGGAGLHHSAPESQHLAVPPQSLASLCQPQPRTRGPPAVV